MGVIKWGQKIKAQKNSLGFWQNPKRSLNHWVNQNNYPRKKSHAEFPSSKNFQKLLKGITQKIKTFGCTCIHRTTQPGYLGTTTNLQIGLNTKKTPTLYRATQKSTSNCQIWAIPLGIFLPKKIVESKNSNPKSIIPITWNPEYFPWDVKGIGYY